MFSCFLITGLKPFPEQRGTCSLICCIPAYFHLAFASLLLLRKALGCWQSSHPEPGPLVVVPSLTAMGSYGHGLLHAVNQCPQRLPRIPQQALKWHLSSRHWTEQAEKNPIRSLKMVLVSSFVLPDRMETQHTALIILWYFEEIVPPADLIRFFFSFCSFSSKPGENIQTYWLVFKVNNSDVPLGSKNLPFQPWNKMLIIDFFEAEVKRWTACFCRDRFLRPFVAFYMPFVAFNGEIKAWNNNTNRKSWLGNSSGLQSLCGCSCLAAC